MNKDIYTSRFFENDTPEWACPTCGRGVLRIKKGTFATEASRRSQEAFSHEAWEPEWTELVYSCLLVCSNHKCKEIVANTGTGGVICDDVEDVDGNWGQVHRKVFRPKYFEPHLKLIHVPDECPASITMLLDESFKLFFSCPSAAANAIRTAIETLLTELKVKRTAPTRAGKRRRRLSLHERIALLPPKYTSLKELIEAIKWLGNAGSHGSDGITTNDVLVAYDLTEHVLAEIYEGKDKELRSLAKKINKKKGPTKLGACRYPPGP